MTSHAIAEEGCENWTNELVLIKTEIDQNEAPMEDTHSIYIEDPILLAMKHENDLNALQLKDVSVSGDEQLFDG